PASVATTPTSPTRTSPADAPRCSTTWPAATGSSTRRARRSTGSRPRGRTSSGSAEPSGDRTGSVVEAERMPGRVEQHAHVVLRLELRQRRAELEGVVRRGGQVVDLDVEVQLHAGPAGLRRPDR